MNLKYFSCFAINFSAVWMGNTKQLSFSLHQFYAGFACVAPFFVTIMLQSFVLPVFIFINLYLVACDKQFLVTNDSAFVKTSVYFVVVQIRCSDKQWAQWSIASYAACKCGAEEQIFEHVVFQRPMHQPLHRLHGLTVLDDETIKWLLNTCPEIWCGLAVIMRNCLKRRSCSDFHINSSYNLPASFFP